MNDSSLPAYSNPLLLFMCFFIDFTDCVDEPAAYITGDVSINCGSAAVSAAHDGRKWAGDKHPKFSSSLQLKGTSTTSSVIRTDSISDYQVPYNTARISRSAFSYMFLLIPGQKFIRLHFNPTAYKGFKRWKDLFDVVAGPFTLLGNFSASLTGDALGLSYFTKEYCLNVEENQLLSIIFSPATSQSRDAYAFINGIEIIPVTSGHSCFHGGGIGARVIGHESQLFYVDNGTALEMVHRGKVGWDSASSGDDLGNIFGMREAILKEKVSDITCKIPVDVGFRYLVRLRFSNRGLKMIENGELIFKVLINEIVACTDTDIFEERDDIVFLKHDHMDFVVIMRGRKEEGKSDLFLQSCHEFIDGHGPFTGFEIFKLSNFDNSLAFPNPLPSTRDSSSWTIHSLLSIIAHRNIIATATVVIVSLVNITVHKLRGILEPNKTEEENKPSARAERFCRLFSLSEIRLGTRNFSDAYLIGKGGFGKVYKCLIDNGSEIVAIKRLKSNSRQGAHEFLTEIETLSELRHVNLVSLIGYCIEHEEMILVYDYMPNGTLADHLYKLARNGSSCSSLAWKLRLDICIGAGRGLDYLHTGNAVIHRDVKASNILLDENFKAKVSDFGLVKHENRRNQQSHVSTKVKGTFGYFDPSYCSSGKLTRKSDVYAFGVVLLEVLSGRPAIDQSVPLDEQILTKWARDKISKGEVDLILASSLRGEILPDSLKTFVQVVERCLDDEPKKRPTMAQVVLQLEFALEQQETTIRLVPNEVTSVSPRDDETNLVDRGQLTMSSTYGRTFMPSPKEQCNRNMDDTYPSSGGNRRKAPAYKLSWQSWNAFWNRFKSPKKKELSVPASGGTSIHASDSAVNRNGASTGLTGIHIDKSVEFSYEELASSTNEFDIGNKIGEGGFGSVYYAELRGEKAAIKKMDFQAGREFLAELKVLTHVHHLNLVQLIGYCVEGSLFLVYEYMDNGNLSQHLRVSGREPLTWSTRVEIALDSARGLEYIHEHTVPVYIHSDIKSTNILIGKNFRAKVADFGLTKLNEVGSNSLPTRLVGTFGYMAPEYAQFGDVSPKVDVYAFGVVLYELISGKDAIVKSTSFAVGTKGLIALFEEVFNNPNPSEDLRTLIDPRLVDYPLESVIKLAQLARACTHENPQIRPTMRSIVVALTTLSSSTEDWDSRETNVC